MKIKNRYLKMMGHEPNLAPKLCVNEALLVHTFTLSFMCPHGSFHATVGEVPSYYRDCVPTKPKIFTM